MARQRKLAAPRIGARQSAARQCPSCAATPIRQVGDPRAGDRGWEYRRRACDACGWTGIEIRAILDDAFAKVLMDVLAQAKADAEEAEAREMAELMAG